ncbi:unnamed protein product, partial [Brassica oleracea]
EERRESSPPPAKKMKVSPSSSGLWSLPDEVAVNCLAQISRFDLAALAIASKIHRSLVSSPELLELRRRKGCTETCFYVCMRISPDPSRPPRWFILSPHHRLNPIPWNPSQASESSSYVAVDGGIYVLGGLIDGRHRTRDVWFLDCFYHTWTRVPSMKMPRASASANLVDGKIYVSGGCVEEKANPTNWSEVFDIKTQTWGHWYLPKLRFSICQSVVIEEEKKVYVVDEGRRSFYLLPTECLFWRFNKTICDFIPGTRNDWCAIGRLLFCRGTTCGRILWCEPNELRWKPVKGLEELYDICRLIGNSAGNIVSSSGTPIFVRLGFGLPRFPCGGNKTRFGVRWNGPMLSSNLILSHTHLRSYTLLLFLCLL